MIAVREAKELLQKHLPPPMSVRVPLCQAYGLKTFLNLYAPFSLPPFIQSSVDGYALRFQNLQCKNFQLLGEVAAGATREISLELNSAIRVMTGAKIPIETDTVVMQEDTKISSNGIVSVIGPLQIGQNMRPIGSHIQKGDPILRKGQIITPAAAGLISEFGLTEIESVKKPSISILTTGNEIIEPGAPLQPGKIYNSNRDMLCAALQEYGITPTYVAHIPDEPDVVFQQIQNALKKSDLLLISGAVSVGSYDFIASSLEKMGVVKIFHGVKQKPGKPLYFGKLKDKVIFGLPGNPGSSLTCFYEYVTMALQSKSSFCTWLPLNNQYEKRSGFTHFLKGFANDDGVEVLRGQDSYMLQSYAVANCLITISEDAEVMRPGELVHVRMIS